jgi:hypothetical protein
MKITKSKLKQIIKEELEAVMESSLYGPTNTAPRRPRRTLSPEEAEMINFDPEADAAEYTSDKYNRSLNTVGISSSEADAEGSHGIDAIRRRRAMEKNYQDARRAINSPISPEQRKIHRKAQQHMKTIGRSLRLKPNGAVDLSRQPDWVEQEIQLGLTPLVRSGEISGDDMKEFMDSLRADRDFSSGLY